ncbi:hypothetical protein B7P43_G17210 [Cryptotermes secundus]|uniref:Uncharacterized protein n=1 Tax=Cryptotermes secundus TaxID=105785 RepID=A0A2J7Q1D6_9NEOP|nr:hypothetical protein B7P43_G17210 [Cryptotermes secundus]
MLLDIEKAFHTTWHSVLLYKLSKLVFSNSFKKFIGSGEREGHSIGPSLPINLPGNVLSRNADFFLWGHVKSSVFQSPVNGLDDLKTHITNAISAIPADMLHRTWQELEYRLDVLRAIKGAHIESFTIICRKLHVAGSICLHATIF